MTENTRWTPGPWRVEGDDGEFLWGCVVIAEDREIECEGRNADEARANTYLVAVAPELYDAVLMLYTYCDHQPTLDAVNAVLKKARNE